jgi:hypothetical protein
MSEFFPCGEHVGSYRMIRAERKAYRLFLVSLTVDHYAYTPRSTTP